MSPDLTGTTDTVTSEPAATTLVSESTGPTESITHETVATTSAPQQTTPTDMVTAKPPTTTQPTIQDTVEPDTFSRSVVVEVVINEEYKEQYKDTNSPEYKVFVETFTDKMKPYYTKKIENFKGVVVTSVSARAPAVRFSDYALKKRSLPSEVIYSIAPRTNSVSVTHDVVLEIPNESSSDTIYEGDVKAIEDAVGGLFLCTMDNCPYNLTTPPVINETETDLGGICERFVNDTDIARFYKPVNVTGVIKCVTVCNRLHTNNKICYNKGICRVYSNVGALCHCLDSTWYLGDDCSLPISKTGFYIGISVTLCFLLLSVVGLSLFLLLNKRKQNMQKDIKKQQVKQWMTEDFEWSRSNSSDDTVNAGGFRNPSFTPDASDQEDPGFRRTAPSFALTPLSLDPDSRGFRASNYPSTQAAPRYNVPFSNAGFSQASIVDFPLSPTMSISRPQIRPSWEI
ncbi:hypothetical protein CesoFtcFv8_027159 [Champsocephalus esox]|uniref:Mucin-17-like n=1 Tax=Champsocephalus esox TaxID=159716 RepID=A0AAN8B0J1_9TELE|nr:hypothetical protein CesoFtcFv8_027159 [Champsocephalus esox]